MKMSDTGPTERCAQKLQPVAGPSGEPSLGADMDTRESVEEKQPTQLTQTQLTYQVHVSAPVSGEESEWPGKAKTQTR